MIKAEILYTVECDRCKGLLDDGEFQYWVGVKIECPNCGEICEAKVEYVNWLPFADYTHECEHCGFMITESEWEKVQ